MKLYRMVTLDLFFYLIRWQLSTPLLYLIVRYIPGWKGVVVANFVGGLIFFEVDRWILAGLKL